MLLAGIAHLIAVDTSEHTGRFTNSRFGGAKETSLEKRLAQGAVGSFALKISLTGSSFLISLILARSLGTAEYGVYAYVLAWVNILLIMVMAGLDTVIVREVAAGQTRSEWGVVRGLLRWSNAVVVGLALIIGSLAAIIALVISRQVNWPQLPAFVIGLVLLPLLALTRLRQAAMQGLQHVIAGQLPEAIIQPAVFIGLILASHLLLGWALYARTAVGLYVIAAGTALVVGAVILHSSLPHDARRATTGYRSKEWLASALPLLLVNGTTVINTQAPILLLGAMKGAQTAGLYAIAVRVGDLIAFGLISVNFALAPVAARLWAQHDLPRLQRVVTKSVRAAVVFTLPVAALVIIFGDKLLSIFGPGFVAARLTMTILVLGQVVNVATGSVGLLLIMTGHERDVAIAIVVSACLNITLNLIMIPKWGLIGTAVAVTISIIVWNVALAVVVGRRLAINPTVIRLG